MKEIPRKPDGSIDFVAYSRLNKEDKQSVASEINANSPKAERLMFNRFCETLKQDSEEIEQRNQRVQNIEDRLDSKSHKSKPGKKGGGGCSIQ